MAKSQSSAVPVVSREEFLLAASVALVSSSQTKPLGLVTPAAPPPVPSPAAAMHTATAPQPIATTLPALSPATSMPTVTAPAAATIPQPRTISLATRRVTNVELTFDGHTLELYVPPEEGPYAWPSVPVRKYMIA